MVYRKEPAWRDRDVCSPSGQLTVEEAVGDGAAWSNRKAIARAIRITFLARALQNGGWRQRRSEKQIPFTHRLKCGKYVNGHIILMFKAPSTRIPLMMSDHRSAGCRLWIWRSVCDFDRSWIGRSTWRHCSAVEDMWNGSMWQIQTKTNYFYIILESNTTKQKYLLHCGGLCDHPTQQSTHKVLFQTVVLQGKGRLLSTGDWKGSLVSSAPSKGKEPTNGMV